MADGVAAEARENQASPAGDLAIPAALVVILLAIVGRLASLWSTQPDLGHGWIVGCFAGWWLVERWRQRPPAIPRAGGAAPRLWAAVPVAVILALVPIRLLLTPYPYWPGLLWLWTAALLLLAGVGLSLAGGRRWLRHFGFASVLIATALPWPQAVQRVVFEPIRDGIAGGAAEILNLVGYPTVAHGTTLEVVGRWVGIEEACGGVRSLQLAIALAVIVGEAAALTRSRRLIAIVLAVGTAIAANFGRVLFLSWRAAAGVPAPDPLHGASGYLVYVLLAGLLALLGWRWHRRIVPPAPRWFDKEQNSAARRWLVLAAVGCVGLEILAAIWFHAGGPWRPTWGVRLPERAPYFARVPLDSTTQEMLQPDRFDGASWVGSDRVARVIFYAEWQQGQAAGHAPFVHNPTVCFPYSGCRLVRELGTVRVAVGGVEIPFRGYYFTRAGRGIVAYFAVWDTDRQQELPDLRSSGGWHGWWRARWRIVMSRRGEIRAQLLTVALVGDEQEMARVGEQYVRAAIEAVISPSPASPQ